MPTIFHVFPHVFSCFYDAQVLHDRFSVDCILGLTATATASTASIVARHIGVTDLQDGIVGKFQLPRNLRLSVSCVENRDKVHVLALVYFPRHV